MMKTFIFGTKNELAVTLTMFLDKKFTYAPSIYKKLTHAVYAAHAYL